MIHYILFSKQLSNHNQFIYNFFISWYFRHRQKYGHTWFRTIVDDTSSIDLNCSYQRVHQGVSHFRSEYHCDKLNSIAVIVIRYVTMVMVHHSPEDEQSILIETSRPHWLFSEPTSQKKFLHDCTRKVAIY